MKGGTSAADGMYALLLIVAVALPFSFLPATLRGNERKRVLSKVYSHNFSMNLDKKKRICCIKMACYITVTIMLFLLLMIIRLHCLEKKSLVPTQSILAREDYACGENTKLRLFLTINSLASVSDDGHFTQRRIEINWYGGKPKDGDTVALFDRDPSNHKPYKPLDSAKTSNHPNGYYVSKIQLPLYKFTKSNMTSKCLGYWAAYLEGGIKVRATACFKAHPTWMGDNKDTLQNLTLNQVALPGSHDAGSYQIYMGKKSENIVTRYMFSQEEDIFHQLVYGIRHLDLRIGHYPVTKEKFWINHGPFKTDNPLSKVLRDVRRFLDATSHEVVILDLHNFPSGFDEKIYKNSHKNLVNVLLQELESHMVPTNIGPRATLGQLWATGKRVVVAYNSRERRVSPKLLWQGVRQVWGDKQNIETLYSYFKNVFGSATVPSDSLWSSMAEMTPTTASIFKYPNVGLRVLANEVNRNVTTWFRDQWWRKATLVATDFILGNDMVQVLIRNNIKKVRCPKS